MCAVFHDRFSDLLEEAWEHLSSTPLHEGGEGGEEGEEEQHTLEELVKGVVEDKVCVLINRANYNNLLLD